MDMGHWKWTMEGGEKKKGSAGKVHGALRARLVLGVLFRD